MVDQHGTFSKLKRVWFLISFCAAAKKIMILEHIENELKGSMEIQILKPLFLWYNFHTELHQLTKIKDTLK